MAAVTKEEAGYEVPAANPNTPCGGCAHWTTGTCEIVAGLIETYAWCQYWQAGA